MEMMTTIWVAPSFAALPTETKLLEAFYTFHWILTFSSHIQHLTEVYLLHHFADMQKQRLRLGDMPKVP